MRISLNLSGILVFISSSSSPLFYLYRQCVYWCHICSVVFIFVHNSIQIGLDLFKQETFANQTIYWYTIDTIQWNYFIENSSEENNQSTTKTKTKQNNIDFKRKTNNWRACTLDRICKYNYALNIFLYHK